jgi:hypothetical protein
MVCTYAEIAKGRFRKKRHTMCTLHIVALSFIVGCGKNTVAAQNPADINDDNSLEAETSTSFKSPADLSPEGMRLVRWVSGSAVDIEISTGSEPQQAFIGDKDLLDNEAGEEVSFSVLSTNPTVVRFDIPESISAGTPVKVRWMDSGNELSSWSKPFQLPPDSIWGVTAEVMNSVSCLPEHANSEFISGNKVQFVFRSSDGKALRPLDGAAISVDLVNRATGQKDETVALTLVDGALTIPELSGVDQGYDLILSVSIAQEEVALHREAVKVAASAVNSADIERIITDNCISCHSDAVQIQDVN